MRKKSKVSDEDMAVFKAALKGVKPLKQGRNKEKPSPSKNLSTVPKYVKKNPPQLAKQLDLVLKNQPEPKAVRGEEFLLYKKVGVPDKTLRKLRKGQYNISATLDLHGMRVFEAKKALNQFLQTCSGEGIRVVRIIHGKGHHSHMPILKNKLNHWLREIDIVLAFCSARALDGNRGAVYVLLKVTRGEPF